MKQFLISTSGNDRIGKTDTFATVLDNAAPAGSLSLVLSTTYSKAKNPDNHLVRQTLHFATKVDLANYARFLQRAAGESQPSTPQEDDELNELLSPSSES
jgi:hypothetical protein